MNNPENCKSTVSSYLSQYQEEIPKWLSEYKNGAEVTFADIMSSRIGYYPGSGFDGTLMKVGNKAHTVHSFLYVDYGISKKDLIDHLAQPSSILGYHSIGRIEWEEKEILPNGEYPLNVRKDPLYIKDPNYVFLENEKPYCFTEILERDEDKDEIWGAIRFCVTFRFADGIDSYYQLFCKEYKKAPWIVLLQDHGWGGNRDRFGKGGLLDAIILKNKIRPPFVLCADHTRIWKGYELEEGLQPAPKRGRYDHTRRLYRDVLDVPK